MKLMETKKSKKRIYICHTFYHVYIACLKELNLPKQGAGAVRGEAALLLSSLSNDFGRVKGKSRKVRVIWGSHSLWGKGGELLPGTCRISQGQRQYCTEHALQNKVYQAYGKAAGSFCAR